MAIALLVSGVGNLWAQTDVTSTYITNADFEGSYSSLTTVTGTALDSRSVQDPDGWTLTCGGTFHKWDSSVLSSSDATYTSNISKRITIPNTGFGNKTYAFRCQGAKSGEVLRLSQTTKTELPRGKYTLSAKLHTDHKDNMEASLYVNQYTSGRVKATTNAGKDVWDDVSKTFTIVNAKTIEIGVYFSHNTTADYTAAVDNVTLSYENYTDDLSTMITKATALSNGSLSSAISTAQGVLDAKDNTVAYQTTIDDAVATLQAAIISAQSADGSSLTPAIQNPGFEGGQSWYIKTTGGDTYDVDGWTKASAFGSSTYHYSCLATDQKSEGSQSFKVRFNWATASQTFTQTIPELPLGRYTLTADVKVTNGSSSTIDAYIQGNSTKGESITTTTTGFQTITAVVDLNDAGNLDIILGMDYSTTGSSSSECIVYWDNITLTYNNPEALYISTKSSAQDTYDDNDYDNVTGDERTALYDLLNPDPAPSTVAEYFAAIDDINDAVAAFIAAKTNYDYYAGIKAENTVMGAAKLAEEPTTAEAAAAGANTLKVNQYTYVSETYTGNVTDLYVGTWTMTNFEEVTNAEHWSGNSTKYFNKWAASGTTSTLSQTMSLPAGSYVLKVAGRGTGPELSFTDGSVTKYFQLLGGEGLGITKTGVANYTEAAETYANENKGYGWEWRFIKLTLAEAADVTVTLKITRTSSAGWGSFSDFAVLATPLTESLNRYNLALTAATTAKAADDYANVLGGSEDVALTAAIDADGLLDKTSTTDLNTATSTLTSRTAAFTNATTVSNYDRLAAAIAEATSIGVDPSAYAVTTSTTADAALSNANTLYACMLNDQKTAKAKKTLGFEKDEYAPYNNVDILAAWVKADAITTVADASTDVLDDAITSLNGASWSSANATEVNAVYDGTLANAPIQATSENVVLPGWVTKSGNTRQTFKGTAEDGKACLADAEANVGLFVHPGTYSYGETTGYTMPLKAGVIYVVRAKYCSWANNSNNDFTLTIKKNGGGNVATKAFGANKTACTEVGALKEVKLFFSPAADGDHTLDVVIDGNTFMTDFHVERATIDIDEDVSYTALAGNAPVTLTRTFNDDAWNTLVLPFDMTLSEAKAVFGDGITIANYTGTTTLGSGNDQLQFSTESASIHANEPVLIYGVSESGPFNITNRSIVSATPTLTPASASYSFVGSYNASTELAAGDYFIASDNNIYYVGATLPTMKGTRAFFRPVGSGDVKAAGFTIDGVETGILTLDGDNSQVLSGDIYTISGVRVSAPVKGLNIVNGKKVFIK